MAGRAVAYRRTREKAAVLVRGLEAAGVPHNDLDALSVANWLTYIISHASRESCRL